MPSPLGSPINITGIVHKGRIELQQYTCHTSYWLSFTVQYVYSGCPLLRYKMCFFDGLSDAFHFLTHHKRAK